MNQADIDLIHGHIKAYEEKRLSVEEFTVLIAQIAEDNFEELEELLPQVEVTVRSSIEVASMSEKEKEAFEKEKAFIKEAAKIMNMRPRNWK